MGLLILCLSLQADSPGDSFHEGRQMGAKEGEQPAFHPLTSSPESSLFLFTSASLPCACLVAVHGNRAEWEDAGDSRPGKDRTGGGHPDASLWDEGKRSWGALKVGLSVGIVGDAS